MTQLHTPTPWEILKDDRPGLKPRICVRTVDKKLSIATQVGPHLDGLHPENKANAEFIVRACNAHDDLLEACRVAGGALLACSGDRLSQHARGRQQRASLIVEAAIAKVTAKQSMRKG